MLSFFGFAYIAGNKLWEMANEMEARNITELSEFYLSLIGMMMGLQFFLTGFMAEMNSRADQATRNYQVRSRVGHSVTKG